MGMVETGESRSHQRTEKKHKKKRRIGIHIDMTPMVDIAFLLLTFFMLTSVFSRPQTMEINLPPEETQVEVAESNLLTLRIDSTGTIFWNVGVEPLKRVEFKDLRNLLVERFKNNPNLITLLKVHREGTYIMMVDIMDELNVAKIMRFSLAPLTPVDKRLIQKASAM